MKTGQFRSRNSLHGFAPWGYSMIFVIQVRLYILVPNIIKLYWFWKIKLISRNYPGSPYTCPFFFHYHNNYRLSSFNFSYLFQAKIAGKRGGKLSEERRYFFLFFVITIIIAPKKAITISVVLVKMKPWKRFLIFIKSIKIA